MLKLRMEILGTRLRDSIQFRANENYIGTKSIESRFIHAFLLLLCFLWLSFVPVNELSTSVYIYFFFFFCFFLDKISIKTRLRYLIWWRGKLFQDKLPIRSRLARCCSLLVQRFWSTPSRYRCFYTLPCKTSNRNYIIKIPPRLPFAFLLSYDRIRTFVRNYPHRLKRWIEGRVALRARVSINNKALSLN